MQLAGNGYQRRFRLGEHGLVLLGFGHLRQLHIILEFLGKPLIAGDHLVEMIALAQQGLCFRGIVPQIGIFGQRV